MPLPGLFDDKAGSALVERITRSAIRAVIRAVVFIAGMVAGFALGVVVLSFGGSAATDFMGVFFGFGLCWLLLFVGSPRCGAKRGTTGRSDTRVPGSFLVLIYLLEFIEGGKPAVMSAYATHVAFALLGVLYLVVLPIGAVFYRRRSRPD